MSEQKDSAAEQRCVKCGGSGSVRNAERRWRTCDDCGGSGSFSEAAASEGVPERIFMQVDDTGSTLSLATWCQDRINESDIEYVRAYSPSVDKATIWKLAQEITYFEEGHCYTSCPEHWTKSVFDIIEAELGGKQ